MRLNKAIITSLHLHRGKSEAIFFDGDIGGFGIRIRESGARSWIFQYDFAGKTKRITIGKSSAVEPGKARLIASEAHGADVGNGPRDSAGT
jgi:hypothetical protein